MIETKEREAYRMRCKHYSELSGHCYKQSGEIGRRMEFVNGKFMWVASGFIDIYCTPDCNCARMKRYDKLNKDKI